MWSHWTKDDENKYYIDLKCVYEWGYILKKKKKNQRIGKQKKWDWMCMFIDFVHDWFWVGYGTEDYVLNSMSIRILHRTNDVDRYESENFEWFQ